MCIYVHNCAVGETDYTTWPHWSIIKNLYWKLSRFRHPEQKRSELLLLEKTKILKRKLVAMIWNRITFRSTRSLRSEGPVKIHHDQKESLLLSTKQVLLYIITSEWNFEFQITVMAPFIHLTPKTLECES